MIRRLSILLGLALLPSTSLAQLTIFEEDFEGESMFPTTSEVGVGGTVLATDPGAIIELTGTAVEIRVVSPAGGAGVQGGLDERPPDGPVRSAAADFFGLDVDFQGSGFVLVETSLVAFTQSEGGEPVPRSLVAASFGIDAAGGFVGVRELDLQLGPVDATLVDLSGPTLQLLLSGVPFSLTLDIDPSNRARASLSVLGGGLIQTGLLPLTEAGPQVGVLDDDFGSISGGIALDPTLGGDDSATLLLDRLALTIDPDPDADGDGVGDVRDNCVEIPNPDQRDANETEDDDISLAGVQHYGDACDADLDDDGIVAPADFFSVLRPCLGKSAAGDPACAVADLDGDGVVGPSDFFSGFRPLLGSLPGPGVTE